MPVCSTVPELKPSIPTQKLEYWFVLGQVPCIVGTTHEPLASLTEPDDPVTAKPLQLVLWLLALKFLGARESWGSGVARAIAMSDIEIISAGIEVRICLRIFLKPVSG